MDRNDEINWTGSVAKPDTRMPNRFFRSTEIAEIESKIDAVSVTND